mmetsp:Transcript_43101/g.125431  ORF Transcript_43101/g.125431 Transcript_43101/m.125431 type:complete len:811 (-) Transcript_43101:33-2465(-)
MRRKSAPRAVAMVNTSISSCFSRGRAHCGSRKDILKQIDADLVAVEDALQRRRQSLAEIDRRLGELQLSPPATAAGAGCVTPSAAMQGPAVPAHAAHPTPPAAALAPSGHSAPSASPSSASLPLHASGDRAGPSAEVSDAAAAAAAALEASTSLPAPPSFAEWLQEHKDFCAAIQKAKRDEESQERTLRHRRQRLQGQLADLQERFFKGESLDASGAAADATAKPNTNRSSAATTAAAARATTSLPCDHTARGLTMEDASAEEAAEPVATSSTHACTGSPALTSARPPSALPTAIRNTMAAPTHRLSQATLQGAGVPWEPIASGAHVGTICFGAAVDAAPAEPPQFGLRACRSAPALPMGATMRMPPVTAGAVAVAALPPETSPAVGFSVDWAACGCTLGAAIVDAGVVPPPATPHRFGRSPSTCARACGSRATAPGAPLATAMEPMVPCGQSRSLSPPRQAVSAPPPWVPVSLRMPLPAVMAMAAGAQVTTIIGHGPPLPVRTFAFVKESERESATTPAMHTRGRPVPAPSAASSPAEAPSPGHQRPLTNLAPVPGDPAMCPGVFELAPPRPTPPATSAIATPSAWTRVPTFSAGFVPTRTATPSRSVSCSTLHAGFASLGNSPGEASFAGSAVAQLTSPPPPQHLVAVGETPPPAVGSPCSSPVAAAPARQIATAATFAVPARVPGNEGAPGGPAALRQASALVPSLATHQQLPRSGAAWGGLPAIISHSASTDKTSGQRSFTDVSGSSFADGLEQWRPRAGHGSFQARAEAMFAPTAIGAPVGMGGPNTTYTGPQPLPRAQPQCPVQ